MFCSDERETKLWSKAIRYDMFFFFPLADYLRYHSMALAESFSKHSSLGESCLAIDSRYLSNEPRAVGIGDWMIGWERSCTRYEMYCYVLDTEAGGDSLLRWLRKSCQLARRLIT